jgi:hypothetical protein
MSTVTRILAFILTGLIIVPDYAAAPEMSTSTQSCRCCTSQQSSRNCCCRPVAHSMPEKQSGEQCSTCIHGDDRFPANKQQRIRYSPFPFIGRAILPAGKNGGIYSHDPVPVETTLHRRPLFNDFSGHRIPLRI